jgi:hypothetical protein
MPATIVVCFQNHFDLVWRRCWNRAYEHEGLTWRSYAEVEEAWIAACLDLAEREGASFQLEQALSLREFLRRRPEALPSLRRLAAEGRFAVCGAGESIIDVNMCLGETMVRNLASGLRWVRETIGYVPPIACHNDGFGSSAQFPQAVRGCGLKGIDNLSYAKPDAPYWRGLDGSTVLAVIDRPGLNLFHDHCYYEPCLACRGTRVIAGGGACPVCRGTGLRLSQGVYPALPWVAEPVPALGRYVVCSEEMLPDATLPARVAARNAGDPAVRYAWGVDDRLLPLWSAALARVDEPGLTVASQVENNPAQTGCWVSRLRVKQAARRAEGLFYAAERLAAVALQADGPRLARSLEPAWLALPLLHFHDAITGTHIDPASQELLDAARDAEAVARGAAQAAFAHLLPGAQPLTAAAAGVSVAVFNPGASPTDLDIELSASAGPLEVVDAAGCVQAVYRQPGDADPPALDQTPADMTACRAYRMPGSAEAQAPHLECVGPGWWAKRGEAPPTTLRFRAAGVPALGTAVFHLRPGAAPAATAPDGAAELDGTALRWDRHGVTGIAIDGEELLAAGKGPAGHLLIEEDEGDPWGTRAHGRRRTSCAGMQRLLRARRTADLLELVFAGVVDNGNFGDEIDPRIFGLHWRQTVRVRRGLPGVEFAYEVFWQAADRRLRVCFPSRSGSDRGLYGIPGGSLERDRYEGGKTLMWAGNGDWPAVGFAATLPGAQGPGLALVEHGTPSFRIEDGVLMCSVLRAPGFGHCLNRYAQEYPMPVSGMRDGGRHCIRFTLLPHRTGGAAALVAAAVQAQLPPLVAQVPANAAGRATGWQVETEGVELAALKEAWDGDGVVLRLIERLGRARSAVLRLPPGIARIAGADHLEDADGQTWPVLGGRVEIPLRAWGIRTLRCLSV